MSLHAKTATEILFLAALVTLLTFLKPADAGHELPYYPSFYPQEIRIETLDPGRAATLLKTNALHAYIGAAPRLGGNVPDHLKFVESLGSYLIVTFNPASASISEPESRCTHARQILTTLSGEPEGFVFHPYPVTPYHADYLQHFDRVEASKGALVGRGSSSPDLKFRARGLLAEALVRPRWQVDEGDWVATLDEVPISDLVWASGFSLNGWLGPPWMKEGWFHAYQLLAPTLGDPVRRQAVDRIYGQLIRGEYESLTARLTLERQLISSLTRGCERVVVGYSVKREYYNDDFSEGIENIAFDSHLGFNSPVFVRTVKLKDFPWNGWLRLGINEKPTAAWNPIGGFTDAPGRLIWAAVGDPALVPVPYNAGWIPNRIDPNIAVERGGLGGIEVPSDAVIPEPGTGALSRVEKGKTSAARITYRLLASTFHDGTQLSTADLLYPYIFAYRWGAKSGQNDTTFDPVIAAATALIRDRLVGVKVMRVERTVVKFGDIVVPKETPVIQVYVNDTSPDSQQLAALVPPWSNLPWHLLVLMEEAVKRGLAAFSKMEAARRGVEWLDLVRAEELQKQWRAVIEEFERQGYRPADLKDYVTAEDARQRWGALQKFADVHGHLLVTNGPYRLKQWSQNSAVLEVFRDLSYPVALGTFDRYAYPPRALITTVKLEGKQVRIEAELEKVVKAQRSYSTVRESWVQEAMRGAYPIRPLARYVMVGPEGSVHRAGIARWEGDGRFTVEITGDFSPGLYTILTAVYPNGNTVNPMVGVVHYQVGGKP